MKFKSPRKNDLGALEKILKNREFETTMFITLARSKNRESNSAKRTKLIELFEF